MPFHLPSFELGHVVSIGCGRIEAEKCKFGETFDSVETKYDMKILTDTVNIAITNLTETEEQHIDGPKAWCNDMGAKFNRLKWSFDQFLFQ